ncbi:protein kinase 4-like [Teleopsis dalmanni]|uniref:protein kinase 4-like n=1 Tax=Teleopsis dalmanni TaxID=139649 RepID=UPI0018CC7D38|nr:protein kinase 4-like [Teleopsis dalmanni]
MAPFKLKFRMGSSRSTSQEHDPDPQVNEALLNHHSTATGASSSTIDSADCNSLGSLGHNERKSLLPNKTNNLRLGYPHHNLSQCENESNAGIGSNRVPSTPPPSYEHVLEEDLKTQRQLSDEDNSQQSRRSSIINLRNSTNLNSFEQLSLNNSQCTDPDCQDNFINNENRLQRQQNVASKQDVRILSAGNEFNDERQINENDEEDDDNRKESIDSTTKLLDSTNMTSPTSQRSAVKKCTGNCQEYDTEYEEDGACGGSNINNTTSNEFFDPLINHGGYCSSDSYCNSDCNEHSHNQTGSDYSQRGIDTGNEDGWDHNQMSSNQYQQQQQQQQNQQQQQQQYENSLTPEIISNKSSKEIYKDLAKQWGITCKMSDGCRCMECQSHYFDCEFDDNEHQKTDGGLGAGTPMFISEVMQGSACTIL